MPPQQWSPPQEEEEEEARHSNQHTSATTEEMNVAHINAASHPADDDDDDDTNPAAASPAIRSGVAHSHAPVVVVKAKNHHPAATAAGVRKAGGMLHRLGTSDRSLRENLWSSITALDEECLDQHPHAPHNPHHHPAQQFQQQFQQQQKEQQGQQASSQSLTTNTTAPPPDALLFVPYKRDGPLPRLASAGEIDFDELLGDMDDNGDSSSSRDIHEDQKDMGFESFRRFGHESTTHGERRSSAPEKFKTPLERAESSAAEEGAPCSSPQSYRQHADRPLFSRTASHTGRGRRVAAASMAAPDLEASSSSDSTTEAPQQEQRRDVFRICRRGRPRPPMIRSLSVEDILTERCGSSAAAAAASSTAGVSSSILDDTLPSFEVTRPERSLVESSVRHRRSSGDHRPGSDRGRGASRFGGMSRRRSMSLSELNQLCDAVASSASSPIPSPSHDSQESCSASVASTGSSHLGVDRSALGRRRRSNNGGPRRTSSALAAIESSSELVIADAGGGFEMTPPEGSVSLRRRRGGAYPRSQSMDHSCSNSGGLSYSQHHNAPPTASPRHGGAPRRSNTNPAGASTDPRQGAPALTRAASMLSMGRGPSAPAAVAARPSWGARASAGLFTSIRNVAAATASGGNSEPSSPKGGFGGGLKRTNSFAEMVLTSLQNNLEGEIEASAAAEETRRREHDRRSGSDSFRSAGGTAPPACSMTHDDLLLLEESDEAGERSTTTTSGGVKWEGQQQQPGTVGAAGTEQQASGGAVSTDPALRRASPSPSPLLTDEFNDVAFKEVDGMIVLA